MVATRVRFLLAFASRVPMCGISWTCTACGVSFTTLDSFLAHAASH
jgi:hypothetical protein